MHATASTRSPRQLFRLPDGHIVNLKFVASISPPHSVTWLDGIEKQSWTIFFCYENGELKVVEDLNLRIRANFLAAWQESVS